jgi:hypothetical protein
MSETEQCMFCLEPTEPNPTPRPCQCHIHYHPHCYNIWIQQYNTSCPLCRKSPQPIVNPETHELEFILVDVVTPTVVETAHTSTPQITEEPHDTRDANRTLCMAVVAFVFVIGLLIIIALRTYNII